MKFDKPLAVKYFQRFFNEILKAKFTESHREGISFLLSEIENDPYWTDYCQVANFLAQIGHETAWKYQPIAEYRAGVGTAARKVQDNYWSTGFYGRGYIQLTHRENYLKMSKQVGFDLVKNPSILINDPHTSYLVAAIGMQKGLFTGKKLNDYINSKKKDYYNARRIVNGTDKAEKIEYWSKCIELFLKVCVREEDEDVRIFSINESPKEQYEEQVTTSTAPEEIPKPDPVGQEYTSIIEQTNPTATSGWKSWKVSATGILSSVGVSIASLIAWAKNLFYTLQPYMPYIVAFTFLAGLVILITYIISRNKLINEREQRAHQLTLKQMEITADPNKFNVEVIKHR